MKIITAVACGILILLALPASAQDADDEAEHDPAGRVLCFQVEGLFARARHQAHQLRAAYDRICSEPTATSEECFRELRRERKSDLSRIYRYRAYGNSLQREYGDMCGGALNDTLAVIGETLQHVGAD